MDTLSWSFGCLNMATSLAISGYGHHSKSLTDVAKLSISRASSIHQVAALGYFILNYNGTPVLPFGLLTLATFLFPGVLYYGTIKGKKVFLSRFVPFGGALHMLFWTLLIFYQK